MPSKRVQYCPCQYESMHFHIDGFYKTMRPLWYLLLPHSQHPTTSHDSEPAESSPHPLTALCKINFSTVLPYMFTPSCHTCILSGFPAERLRVFSSFLVVFHMSLICMSIRIVTKSVDYLRYGRLSVRPFALSAGIQLGGFS
jgi:hypothetical protein